VTIFFSKQVFDVFYHRWDAFHSKVMTAAFAMHPHFCRRDLSGKMEDEVLQVMEDLSKAPGAPSFDAMQTDWSEFKTSLLAQQFRLTDEIAFSPANMAKAPHVWVDVFMAPWKALRWFALKIVSLPCSASACEHSWSIEGWIHSPRRNRLGQKLVEKLVRAHTNLVLKKELDDADLDILPWDIELVIDTPSPSPPTSDDEDDEDDEDEDED
jgi:hypothetical protein